MLHAVTYALLDSVNALLIGILVGIGMVLPRGAYRKVAALVIVGDWLGVLSAATVVTFLFVGIREQIAALLASPLSGWILIVVGVGIGWLSWRSQGQPNEMVARLLVPLREASATTLLIGFVMGAIQSLTSLPFFVGLMFLATGGFSPAVITGGLVIYSSLALSLPLLCGLFMVLVRIKPRSWAGRWFARAREDSSRLAVVSGYVVAVFLVVSGLLGIMP